MTELVTTEEFQAHTVELQRLIESYMVGKKGISGQYVLIVTDNPPAGGTEQRCSMASNVHPASVATWFSQLLPSLVQCGHG